MGEGLLLREKGEISEIREKLEKPNWPRLSPSVCVTSKINPLFCFIFDTDSLFPQFSAFVLPGFLFALLANGLLVIIFSFAPQFGAVQFSLEICAKHEPTFVFIFSYGSVPNCSVSHFSVSYFSVPYCCFCVSALPHGAELAGSKCYASVATKVTPPAFVCFLVCYLYICFFDV